MENRRDVVPLCVVMCKWENPQQALLVDQRQQIRARHIHPLVGERSCGLSPNDLHIYDGVDG